MNKQLRNDIALPTHFMTDEQQALADQAGKFFMSEFHHLNAEMDDTDDLPSSVFPKLGEMGYLGLNVPPEFGGAGLDFTSACIITEQLSRSSAAIGLTHVAHDNLCVNNIYRNANDELRRKYLPGLCDGTLIGALGLTEPGAGSDALGSMRTTAKKDGDDYILNGAKIYITNGPIADLVLVYAKTSPEKGAKGISAFIVETDTPGFKVAQKLNKMGRANWYSKIAVFRPETWSASWMAGLPLPCPDLIWNVPSSVSTLWALRSGRWIFPSITPRHASNSANRSPVFRWFRRCWPTIEAARSLSLRTAAMCEGLEEGEGGRGEIHKLTAAAIYKAAEATSFVLDKAVQIHGGSGYMRDTEVNRLYRTGRVLEVGAGTQEVRKLIISGELLKN